MIRSLGGNFEIKGPGGGPGGPLGGPPWGGPGGPPPGPPSKLPVWFLLIILLSFPKASCKVVVRLKFFKFGLSPFNFYIILSLKDVKQGWYSGCAPI